MTKHLYFILLLLVVIVGCAVIQEQQERQNLQTQIDQFKKRVEVLEKNLTMSVTITAYSSEVSQTDSTPYTTAFITRVKPWTIAVSEDLFNKGWVPGKKVYMKGIGVFVINDLMNKRKGKWIDVWFGDTEAANEFGIKKGMKVTLLEI